MSPQQPRAWHTVDRLLDATNRMLLLTRTLDELTLDMVAAQAGVTPQSAYRYFANIDDLVRTSVRRMQADWHSLFLDVMLRQPADTVADIAQAIAQFTAETYGSQIKASARLSDAIFRQFLDVDYDAAWIVSDTIVSAIGAGCAPPVRVGEMAAGLTALWAIAKCLILQDARQMRQRNVQDLMAAVLLAALTGSPQPQAAVVLEPL